MKVNEPLIENLETATEAYETAIEVTREQEAALNRLKDDINKYMSYENGRKVVRGDKFIQGFIANSSQDIGYDELSGQLTSIIPWFDEDKIFKTNKLGRLFDKLESNIINNRKDFVKNLDTLESFRGEIQNDYKPGSHQFPDDWTPSDTYIGTEENRHRPDIELFQSNLSQDNLRDTSMAERLEKLEETVDYLEELVDYNQGIVDEETVKANERFFQNVEDFNFPVLNGLLESLRIARTEKQGLEHFLIHNDEHDYLLQRWRKELEHDLFDSDWRVYGEEVDYFEDEPLSDKNQLPDSKDADFWRDGEFDILLKNGDEYAYIEVKSYDKAEETAREQLERVDNHDSLLIRNNGSYERIDTEDVKKFWTNEKPQFDVDYSREITQSGAGVARLDKAN